MRFALLLPLSCKKQERNGKKDNPNQKNEKDQKEEGK
jgi:hypothetical protein